MNRRILILLVCQFRGAGTAFELALYLPLACTTNLRGILAALLPPQPLVPLPVIFSPTGDYFFTYLSPYSTLNISPKSSPQPATHSSSMP